MSEKPGSEPQRVAKREYFVPNDDGWLLHVARTVDDERFDPALTPVVIVPGYGMNSFIFGFHPRGTSLVGALAAAGHEVWTADFRAQGASRADRRGAPGPSLRAYADIDVTAIVAAALARTQTVRDRVVLIGASLGGSLAYAHLALRPEHRVAALVAIGAPLRWTEVHPALGLAFHSPRVAGMIRLSGVRRIARVAAPVIARVPGLLTPYMNTRHVDLSALPELVRTIEDPHPRVNRDLALWIKRRDMVLRGVHVTNRLRAVDVPLLVVVANRDGIVPDGPALSVLDAWGGKDVEVLRVGDDDRWYAHADLFVGDHAPTDVFAPMNAWLLARRR